MSELSIYDTKDVFIKELQVILAQRLLAIKDYQLDREVGIFPLPPVYITRSGRCIIQKKSADTVYLLD